MNNPLSQYQTQLELERVILSNRIQVLAADSQDGGDGWVDTSLLRHFHNMLHRIEEAQKRLENGRYGQCQLCKAPIDPERLAAAAYVENCISCQRQVERQAYRNNHLYN